MYMRLLLLSLCFFIANETYTWAMCTQSTNEKIHPSQLMEAIRTKDVNAANFLIQSKQTSKDKFNYVNKSTSSIRFKRIQHPEGSPLLFASQQYIASHDVRLLKIISLLLTAGADPKVTPAGQVENSLQLVIREKSYPIVLLFANYFERIGKSVSEELGTCFFGISPKDLEQIIYSVELLKEEQLVAIPSEAIDSMVNIALKNRPAEFYVSALEDKRLRVRDLIFKRMIAAGALITVPMIDQEQRRDPLNILLEKDRALFVQVVKLPHLFESVEIWSHYKIQLVEQYPKELGLLIHMMQAEKVLSSEEKNHYLYTILHTFQDDLTSLIQIIQIPNLLDEVNSMRFLNMIQKNFISRTGEMIKLFKIPKLLRPWAREKFLQAVYQQYKNNQDVLFSFVDDPDLLLPSDRFSFLSKMVDSSLSDMDLLFRVIKLKEMSEEHLKPFADKFFALYEKAINEHSVDIVKKYLGQYSPEFLPFRTGQAVSARDRYLLYYRLAQNLGSGYLLKRVVNTTVVTQRHLDISFGMFSDRSESDQDFTNLQLELLKIFDRINFDELEKSGTFYRNALVDNVSVAAIRHNITQITATRPYGNHWRSFLDEKRHKNLIAFIVRELPKLSPELQAQVLTTVGRGRSCAMGVMGTLILAQSMVFFQSGANQYHDVVTRILYALTLFRMSLFIDEAMKSEQENQHILNYLYHRFGKLFGLPGPHPAVFEHLSYVPANMKEASYYNQFVGNKYNKKAIIRHLLDKVHSTRSKDISNHIPFQDLVEWCKMQKIPMDHLMFDPETMLFTELGMETILMDPLLNVLSFE